MTSDRMFLPRGLALLGAAAIVVWASAGVATAQDKSAPANKQDAKAPEATKAKQDAAAAKPGSAQSKRIGQRTRAIPPKRPAPPVKRGAQSKGRVPAPPKPTVVLKPGEVPNISFDTPTYDFGRVRAGQPIKHDFWFTNTGTGPLEILRVKPS